MLRKRAAGLVAGAVVALGAGARPALGECRVSLSHGNLPAVTVRAGARTWPVRVEGGSGSLIFDGGPSSLTAELTAPLAFRGTVQARTLRLAPKRPVDLFDGRIRLGRHAIGRWSAGPGGIQPSLHDTLALAVDPPPVVPCVDLQVVNEVVENVWSVGVKAGGKGAASLVPGQIQLFPAAGQGTPVRVAFGGQVSVLAHRAPWAQIETIWDDGSRVRGWVRGTDVDPRPGAAGGSGVGSSVPGVTGCADAQRFTPVTLRKGAQLADAPDGAVWAHVTETIPAQALPSPAPKQSSNPSWVQIGSLKGLPATTCDPLQFVWARAADVVSAGRPAAAETAGRRR
jgi:hypothetical protein